MAEQAIYLNHAGTSWPKPPAVVEAVVEAMNSSPKRWSDRFEQAHSEIAEFFGIGDPAQLLITPGCTSSIAVGLGDIDLEGRRRVLTSTWEHHAMHRPLLQLREAGIAVDYIPPDSTSALDLDQLEHRLAKGDVGLVAITASANVTGDVLPYQTAIELAHQYDAQVFIDAAQVVGWLDLDLIALGADVVAFGGHKGLQGPWGIGGLYFSADARTKCAARSGNPSPADKSQRPGYCDVGSVDQVALAGLHAAIRWLKASHRAHNLAQARKQIAYIESALNDAGARCIGIHDPGGRMPTVAFSAGSKTSSEFAATLRAEGVIVGSGHQCAPLAHSHLGTEAEGLVRVSVGPLQDANEIRTATETICRLL